MAKLTLSNLANLNNETSAVNTINNNSDLIETAIENTLSRDGTSPNSMGADLDMNSNQILNLPVATTDTEPVRKGEFDDALDAIQEQFEDIVVAGVVTDSIDNTFLANMAEATIKGRAAGAGTGDPQDLTATQVATIVDSFFLTPAEGNAAYQPLDSDLTAIAALSTTSFGRALLALADATALAALVDASFLTPAEGNAAYQPLDADLTAIAALTTTPFGRSVLDRANAAALATLAGVGTGDSPQFTAVNVGAASDTTLARSGAGDLTVEGNAIYRAGGTDVPVADGGSGRSATTAYAVLCGGTTTTGPEQSIASVGSAGQVLTSNGAGALPTFQSGSANFVLQVLENTYTTNTAISTIIPLDDTTPTNSEGTQILSQAITLASASSRVRVEVSVWGTANGSGENITVAVFRGSTCINVSTGTLRTSGDHINVVCLKVDSPATSGSVTYTVRVGPGATNNIYMNGTSSARRFGGTSACTLTLTELAS